MMFTDKRLLPALFLYIFVVTYLMGYKLVIC